MLFIWGKALHGSIRQGAGTHIATVFHHVWYVPVIPERSVVVMDVPGSGEEVILPLARFHRRSLLLGWSPVLFPALSLLVAIPLALAAGLYAGALVVAAAIGAASWLHAREPRFSHDDEDWQRRVRSRWLGAPLDVSMEVFNAEYAEHSLRVFMETHLRDNPIDYRAANVGDRQTEAALHERMVDIDFLIAAATLAELAAHREQKASAAPAIWEKAISLCPALREAPAFYGRFGIEGAYPVYRATPSLVSRFAWPAVLAAVSVGVLGLAFMNYQVNRHPRFALVSPIGANVEVEIDGAPVREPFRQALGGGDWLDLTLEAGVHHVIVRHEGRIIDERSVEIRAGAKGYVFVAKGSEQAWCAYRETVRYGRAPKTPTAPILVARAGETATLERAADAWFVEPPSQVSSKSSSTRDVLYLTSCE